MFGIVMSFNLCIGLVTPPVGLCLLLSNQIGETSLSKSLKALMPLLLISIVVAADYLCGPVDHLAAVPAEEVRT